jgi:AcrR family transcriptional regulator
MQEARMSAPDRAPDQAPAEVTVGSDFRRARRPEQREQRRQAILDAAAAMLAEMPVADISLRELSRRVGLAGSNVLRYFETREGVFLALLDKLSEEWLDQLERDLGANSSHRPVEPVERIAQTWARSLASRPLLCELTSVLSGVLERNVSVDSVREFKRRAIARNGRLASLIRGLVPELSERAALEIASLAHSLLAGLWPLANPGPVVRAATEDPELAAAHVDFTGRMTRGLLLLLAGQLATRKTRERDF